MRGQKITLGEMRSSGVRGLLVYCADYQRGAQREGSALIDDRNLFGSLIWSLYSFVRRAADEAVISGPRLGLGTIATARASG
jgi:hypothetical protein